MAQHSIEIPQLAKIVQKVRSMGANVENIVDDVLGKGASEIADAAKTRVYAQGAVDTGALATHITFFKAAQCQWVVASREGSANSGEPYGVFIEFGTGSAGDPEIPHTAKPKWVYFNDKLQEFRTAYPQRARPFMRPAFAEKKDTIPENLKAAIVRAWLNGG